MSGSDREKNAIFYLGRDGTPQIIFFSCSIEEKTRREIGVTPPIAENDFPNCRRCRNFLDFLRKRGIDPSNVYDFLSKDLGVIKSSDPQTLERLLR